MRKSSNFSDSFNNVWYTLVLLMKVIFHIKKISQYLASAVLFGHNEVIFSKQNLCLLTFFLCCGEDSMVLSGAESIRSRLGRTILKHPFTHSHQIALNLSPVEQIAWTTDFPVWGRIDQALKSAGQCKANFWRQWCAAGLVSVSCCTRKYITTVYFLLRTINVYRWCLILFAQ